MAREIDNGQINEFAGLIVDSYANNSSSTSSKQNVWKKISLQINENESTNIFRINFRLGIVAAMVMILFMVVPFYFVTRASRDSSPAEEIDQTLQLIDSELSVLNNSYEISWETDHLVID